MEMQLSRMYTTRLAEMERLVSFLNKTEGRDKATKFVQYACRFFSYVSVNSKTTANKFAALYRASADSRKLFRLGKFVSEIAAILRLAAAKTPDTDAAKKIQLLQVLCRAAFCCYWICDNAFILGKLKVTSNKHQQRLAQLSGLFWTVGLMAGVWCEVLRLREAAAAAKLLETKEMEDEGPKEAAAARLKLQQTRKTARLNLVKQCCDLVPAVNLAGLPLMLLQRNFNDGFVGAAGTVSAAIACSQLY